MVKALEHLEAGMQLLILRQGVEENAHGESTFSTRLFLLISIVYWRSCGLLLNESAPPSVSKRSLISAASSPYTRSLCSGNATSIYMQHIQDAETAPQTTKRIWLSFTALYTVKSSHKSSAQP